MTVLPGRGALASVRATQCLALLGLLAISGWAEANVEELLLQQLDDGATMAHFEFTATVPLHTRHAGTFPPALLGLAQQRGVTQLQLSLTQGRWTWEQQRQAAAAAAAAEGARPPGLELKAAFSPAVADTQAAYGALTQTLGGLLCAGVAMAPRLAVMAAPSVGWFAHHPPALAAAGNASSGGGAGAAAVQARQVYAWLPQEAACTENLAAWRRLLPCREQAGLAALLSPLRLAAAPYFSLELQLQVVQAPQAAGGGGSGGGLQLELRQALTAVLPPLTAAAAQQQQQGSGAEQKQQLLEAVFSASAPQACPATASSTLYVAQPSSGPPAGSGCALQQTPAGQVLACDAAQAGPLLPLSILLAPSAGQQAETLQVVQHAAQLGSQAGTLVVGVRVPAAALRGQAGAAGQALLHVMQLLPWQLPADAASLDLRLDGRALRQGAPELAWATMDARSDRTSVLELLLRLPDSGGGNGSAAWHELAISVGYRAAFLGVFDHAPDASRGVDVPPAVATLLPPGCAAPPLSSPASGEAGGSLEQPPLLRRLRGGCGLQRAYGGAAGGGAGGGCVVSLPIPDFSMPFNVVCFTSTLLAVLLGGVANVVLRSPEELAGGFGPGGGTPAWKRRARRVAALLVLTAGLAVYLDRDLQRQADALLHHWVLGRHTAPEQHGEL